MHGSDVAGPAHLPHQAISPALRPLTPSVRRRLTTAAILAVLVLPLPGCQSIAGTTSISEVRILDASPDAPGLDIYQGSSALAYNLGLGTITSYVPISPGNYTIVINNAGTRQQLVTANGVFLGGGQYTVLVGNYSSSMQEIILRDNTLPAPSGEVNIRFIDQSTRAGLMDLYFIPAGSTIATVRPVLTGVAFNANTGYFTVPTGTYTLVAVPAGTVPTAKSTTLYTGAAIAYASGSSRTVVLLDQQLITTPGVQAIIANDFDPAGTN
jgi:hypothetical protein